MPSNAAAGPAAAFLRSAQLGEAADALHQDESFKAKANQGGRLPDASQPSRFLKESVVDVQRGPHKY